MARNRLRFVVWPVAIAVLISTLALAGNPPESLDPLASFQFQGVRLSASFGDLKRRFPSVIVDQKGSDQKVGLATYLLIPPTSKVNDGVQFDFVDGRLYCMLLMYTGTRINQQGGVRQFGQKIMDTFGMPDEANKDDNRVLWHWFRREHNRRLEVVILSDASAGIKVIDTAAEEVLNARRAKAAN